MTGRPAVKHHELRRMATAVRRALVGAGDPTGLCIDWALCFRLALRARGVRSRLVWGQLGPAFQHYWVRVDDLDCDGTADQFPGLFLPPVSVRRRLRFFSVVLVGLETSAVVPHREKAARRAATRTALAAEMRAAEYGAGKVRPISPGHGVETGVEFVERQTQGEQESA